MLRHVHIFGLRGLLARWFGGTKARKPSGKTANPRSARAASANPSKSGRTEIIPAPPIAGEKWQMRGVVWTSTSGSWGLSLSAYDRRKYFRRNWTYVLIEIPGIGIVYMALTKKFWTSSGQLHSVAIRQYLKNIDIITKNNKKTWRTGQPPNLWLTPVEDNRFRLRDKPSRGYRYYAYRR